MITYELSASDTPEAFIETTRNDKDDAIAEAHRIADERQTNVAVVAVVKSLLAFIRPSHTYQGPEPINVGPNPETASAAVRAAYAEALRHGIELGYDARRDGKEVTDELVAFFIDQNWPGSRAHEFFNVLQEIEKP